MYFFAVFKYIANRFNRIWTFLLFNQLHFGTSYKQSLQRKAGNSLKRFVQLGIVLLVSIIVISACGKKEPDKITDEKRDEPTLTTEIDTEGGSIESGDGYGFTLFDLAITTDEGETIKVWYDVSKYAEATYENSKENVYVEENEAMDQTFVLFNTIHLDKDTPEDQVIGKILDYYSVEDYTTFKLDVNFDENTKLRIDR